MEMQLKEIRLCPNCGSTDYIPDYPEPGLGICTECGKEIIKLIPENISVTERCPACNSKDFDWIRSEDNEEFIAFKCNCGKVSCYKRESTDHGYISSDDVDDDNWSSLGIKIAQQEGKPVLSASRQRQLIKELERQQKSPEEKCKRILFDLFEKTAEQLMHEGISHDTLTGALGTAHYYLCKEGVLTENQAVILFAASIPLEEKIQLKRRRISKCHATERVIADMFKVDRKTIRKWKNKLGSSRSPPLWNSFTHHPDGSTSYVILKNFQRTLNK